MWRTIFSCYGKSPYFMYYADKIEQILMEKHKYLMDLNLEVFLFLKKSMNLSCELHITSQYIVDCYNNLYFLADNDNTTYIYTNGELKSFKHNITKAMNGRIYVIDDNDITQITRDHSLVEEMVLAGKLSKSEARTHARKNVITRAIGGEEQVEPEMFSIDLKENSKVLMCSDGLTNMLEDAEILSIVRNNSDIEDAARMLIDRANENGGKDNISVIIVEL